MKEILIYAVRFKGPYLKRSKKHLAQCLIFFYEGERCQLIILFISKAVVKNGLILVTGPITAHNFMQITVNKAFMIA